MSKVGEISIDKLLKTVDLTLEDYANGVDKCLKTASKEAGESAEDELHHTSPERTGNYRRSWTFSEKEIKELEESEAADNLLEETMAAAVAAVQKVLKNN